MGFQFGRGHRPAVPSKIVLVLGRLSVFSETDDYDYEDEDDFPTAWWTVRFMGDSLIRSSVRANRTRREHVGWFVLFDFVEKSDYTLRQRLKPMPSR